MIREDVPPSIATGHDTPHPVVTGKCVVMYNTRLRFLKQHEEKPATRIFFLDDHHSDYHRERPWLHTDHRPTLLLAPGGFYDDSQHITLATASSDAEIRYTLDGTVPDQSSELYTNPIEIDTTTAVRACAYEKRKKASAIITHTFLFTNLTICQLFPLWPIPTTFLMMKPVSMSLAQTVCQVIVPIHPWIWIRIGNADQYRALRKEWVLGFQSRCWGQNLWRMFRTRYPQKSWRFFARSEYGKGSFSYQLFPDKPIKKFESFVLRCSADDQVYTLFRDALTNTVVKMSSTLMSRLTGRWWCFSTGVLGHS